LLKKNEGQKAALDVLKVKTKEFEEKAKLLKNPAWNCLALIPVVGAIGLAVVGSMASEATKLAGDSAMQVSAAAG
jgi:hypothetical protein